jgi:undecaprenyl diphosphate synthase
MKEESFKLSTPINHIAFIMDGNGRWAKKRLLPRHLGHKEGCLRIIEILRACKEFGVKAMSLYAFSTENWKRPKDEIDHLFDYLDEFFKREIDNLMKDDVQVRTMGDLTRLPPHTQNTIKEAKERTKNNKTVILNICLNYGGRDEIVRAINKAINENNGEITEEKFATYLDSTGLPEVDLLIRTSGEQRLSNYMLWQMAYAEFIFTPTYWPDFKREHLIECLKEFESRNRRFGGL